MSAYQEFLKRTIKCEQCRWVGFGGEMEMGDSFGDGADKHCPVCDWRYGFVAWPMSHEFERAPTQTH
jgi:hypothetical protein